jgi:hypothetical protein
MRRKPFRTDYRIWALATAGMFVPFWFLDRLASAAHKGDDAFWAHVGMLVRTDYFFGTEAAVASAACQAIQMTVAAALVGWVIQALIVVLWSLVRREPAARG